MSLLTLPNELLFHIAGLSSSQGQVYAMARSCRRLYHLLRKYLLQYNIRYSDGSALIWAAKMDRRNLVRRLLRLGAKVDTFGKPQRRGTPLHYAAAAGHLGMIELLLKNRGNLEVCGYKGCKPILLALLARHEQIAIFLFNKTEDPNSLVAGATGYTALHVACSQRLSKSARVFLESGADVHARTAGGRTPLHLALALKPETSDTSNDTARSCTLQIVMLLLEFGSNKDPTAYRLGLQHPDPQVRDIFQEHESLSPREASFISIGRPWSVDLDSNVDSFFSPMLASTSRGASFLTTVAENMADDEVFPAIGPFTSIERTAIVS